MIVCIKNDIDHPLNEPAVQVRVRGETINCVWTEVTSRAALVAVPEHRAYGVSLTMRGTTAFCVSNRSQITLRKYLEGIIQGGEVKEHWH